MAISAPCSRFPEPRRGRINERKCCTIRVGSYCLFRLRRGGPGDNQYNVSSTARNSARSRSVGAQAQPRYPYRRLYGRGEAAREGGGKELLFSIDQE